MKISSILFSISILIGSQSLAQKPLKVPEKTLPIPTTVSPQMQKLIGAPYRTDWDVLPQTGEQWKVIADSDAKAAQKTLPELAKLMKVKVEPIIIEGVRAYMITPETIAPHNNNRILINMHGGCYVLNAREAGLPEAVMLAGFGGYKVVAVDYRMPPEAFYPGALDDGMKVWKALLKTNKPENIGIFGTSAGGALTLAMVLKAKSENIPMPGAIASGTPMSDVTKTGDTFYTNELVDNILVSRDGFCDAGTKVYANGHSLEDPLLSPVYGDLTGFPPTILTSGTRDLLLSNTVRVHRKLRQAKVETALHVYEGQSHAHYLFDVNAPETKEVFTEIADFLDKYMGQ
ncbi:alpha/beta hydrolase [Chryseobacterium potabilaquae]|uniref:Monoterpene epsilon-lactone hydrolase n=1 Tax=Chryseobacterium potabilaquae TaxID=2675057 RepID=A0A6N4X335_9FLAO|nr:alpha/beta hydrolase [Chryseobacterium potabilaquae]CAA7194322.1 Monoterpene epsilon-lactone hydrolase [Chryseobacterium potabilaquae]